MRGMRSLLVRRLAGADADAPGVRPHEWIARDVSAFLGATERIGAYIAPASDDLVLGGAAVSAACTDDGWVINTSTAAGVHTLRATTAEDAADAVVELAESAHNGTLFKDPNLAAAWTCVVRFGADAQNTIVLGPHSVRGTVDGNPVSEWDPAFIRGLFAAS
ncbi:hypothetical protein BRW64_18995 [Mycolicibacterium diernhoferi]|uniref:Uncharacterized protein n=1 Tax=Mycolicibacterium diernhoferi TaxID=1801 RepID=A0A1Q4H9J4_9MYCO|nr:hypothetical protein BRW64_18995 [Mycolicibacterium diernhoferi]PEG55208.1 hypothetical protein CRI78_06405 [Mycolicibacterium diernhoferi]